LATLHHGGIFGENSHERRSSLRSNEALQSIQKAFDEAWILAIEQTGNRHWYTPLPKSQRKTARTLLA
jgi:hypothetical protein